MLFGVENQFLKVLLPKYGRVFFMNNVMVYKGITQKFIGLSKKNFFFFILYLFEKRTKCFLENQNPSVRTGDIANLVLSNC